jgi:hypothetical protein
MVDGGCGYGIYVGVRWAGVWRGVGYDVGNGWVSGMEDG